jgi:hypothetical protein
MIRGPRSVINKHVQYRRDTKQEGKYQTGERRCDLMQIQFVIYLKYSHRLVRSSTSTLLWWRFLEELRQRKQRPDKKGPQGTLGVSTMITV